MFLLRPRDRGEGDGAVEGGEATLAMDCEGEQVDVRHLARDEDAARVGRPAGEQAHIVGPGVRMQPMLTHQCITGKAASLSRPSPPPIFSARHWSLRSAQRTQSRSAADLSEQGPPCRFEYAGPSSVQ